MVDLKEKQEISKQELDALIARVEYAIENELSLDIEDLKLLLLAINTLCSLQQRIEDDDITLYKLRKLLGIVKQSESRKRNNNNKSTKKAKKTKKSNNKKEKQSVYKKT